MPINRFLSLVPLIALALVGRSGAGDEQRPIRSVLVRLTNGRTLSGRIDARTDDAELWLHSTAPSIVLVNAIAWSDVESVIVGEESYTPKEFNDVIDDLKSPVPEVPRSRRIVGDEPPSASATQASADRIQSIDIDATLANWNREWEPDGIELRIRPRTADNSIVAVDGLVTVRLYGRRTRNWEELESRWLYGFVTDGSSPRIYAPPRREQNYIEVGRWTVRLNADDLLVNGHVVRLPFRRFSPEYDLSLTPDGEVHAHVSLKGQGVFNASYPVQLRGYSPLRDTFQLDRGTRFFPGEYQAR